VALGRAFHQMKAASATLGFRHAAALATAAELMVKTRMMSEVGDLVAQFRIATAESAAEADRMLQPV
jgi:HPt (histidine-containing phosphotransfer) domain-containing protein